LVDFDTNALVLREAGIRVVAVSVDSVEATAKLFSGMHLRYSKAVCEVDVDAVVAATGAATETRDHTFLHATGFLLDPTGAINQSCYSTGPIGRLTCSDILKKVAFQKFVEARANK